jgi:hypothetical protein
MRRLPGWNLGRVLPRLESSPESRAVRATLATFYARIGRTEDAINMVKPLEGASDLISRATHSGVLAFLGRPRKLEPSWSTWRQDGSASTPPG